MERNRFATVKCDRHQEARNKLSVTMKGLKVINELRAQLSDYPARTNTRLLMYVTIKKDSICKKDHLH